MERAAYAYHVLGKTKVQIGEELGISRFKAARLLDRARETGVVRIEIRSSSLDLELTGQLQRIYPRTRMSVAAKNGEEESGREAVARLAARLLSQETYEGCTVGLAWGRTVAAIVKYLVRWPRCELFQLTGNVGNDIAGSPTEVIRRASEMSGANARGIFAPIYVRDSRAATTLRGEPAIEQILNAFDSLNTVVASVGSLDPMESKAFDLLSAGVRDQLRTLDCVGETCGIPIDSTGNAVDHPLIAHMIGVTFDQLVKCPSVMALAAGERKTRVSHALALSPAIKHLVVDPELARSLIAFNASAA